MTYSRLHNTTPEESRRGECMKGSVHNFKGSWYVRWYDATSKRDVKIYRYKGEKIYSQKTAQKLLSVMQSDHENGTFYIEKYTNDGFSEIVPFFQQWIDTSKDSLSPATIKGYRSYLKNHIGPFFKERPLMSLPDIQLDVLKQLKSGLVNSNGEPLSPKMRLNVMNFLHVLLDSAWRSRRIASVPPFPQKKDYQLEKKPIQWLPSERQMAVLEKIPDIHKPIFYWLKYHLRRPAEACALHKIDFQDGVFTVHRSISAKQLTGKTKTGEIHITPCHPDFIQFIQMEAEKKILSPFFFANPQAVSPGKRYTGKAMNQIWHAACNLAGESIGLYAGLKHSSCSQYINEVGLSESELQVITDHANLASVRPYAKTEVKRKLELMTRIAFENKERNVK